MRERERERERERRNLIKKGVLERDNSNNTK